MYNPAHFRIDDPIVIGEFLDRHNFALLVSDDGTAPIASHLPLLYERDDAAGGAGRLLGHMARPNPQWKSFRPDREIMAVFSGPHAYVSPSWYATAPAVPTWNYAAVHAYGTPELIENDAAVLDVLTRTVNRYESGRPRPWTMDLPADYLKNMMRGIVAFQVRLTRFDAKFKLNQNRSAEDRAGVAAALRENPDADSQAVAAMMTARL